MKKGTCNRCGFPLHRSIALKSRHTKSIYCPDLVECERRYRNELNLAEMETKITMLLEAMSV